YFSRRSLLAAGLGGAIATGAGTLLSGAELPTPAGAALTYSRNPRYTVNEAPNKYDEITEYNNFYEFGTDKEDPKAHSQQCKTRPWSVSIEGEAQVKGRFTLEDILKPHALEERIYRFRCVEAWSLVVPWVGFPLADLIARFKPTSKAK